MRLISQKFLAIMLAVALAAPGVQAEEKDKKKMAKQEAPTMSIVELAAGNENLSTLVTLLTAAELVDTVAGLKNATVFAPTNAAFAKLSPAIVEKLTMPENKELLQQILLYHVVPNAAVPASYFKFNIALPTAAGKDLIISKLRYKVNEKNYIKIERKALVNNATVAAANVRATNGIVHLLDSVLLLPIAEAVMAEAAAPSVMAPAVEKEETADTAEEKAEEKEEKMAAAETATE